MARVFARDPETTPVAEPTSDVAEIDPDALEPAGKIELKQYTVAWVGSGTMGGGTLIVDNKEYPFRLAGLGIGGYGASSIDGSGVVYNLPDLDAFAGTYGNARLGMTGGDSGGGKLWLRNPDGVVIDLESEMRGLAFAGGVDGILIQWADDKDSGVDEALDHTRDVARETIEAGADVVQEGVNNVKAGLRKSDPGRLDGGRCFLGIIDVLAGLNPTHLAVFLWIFAAARIAHILPYHKIATERNPSPRSYFYVIAMLSHLVLVVMIAVHMVG